MIKFLFFFFFLFFLLGDRDGERGGCFWRADTDVGGADGIVEAHSAEMPIGERGVSQVQEEGSEPGEVPRQRPASHSLRLGPVCFPQNSIFFSDSEQC